MVPRNEPYLPGFVDSFDTRIVLDMRDLLWQRQAGCNNSVCVLR